MIACDSDDVMPLPPPRRVRGRGGREHGGQVAARSGCPNDVNASHEESAGKGKPSPMSPLRLFFTIECSTLGWYKMPLNRLPASFKNLACDIDLADPMIIGTKFLGIALARFHVVKPDGEFDELQKWFHNGAANCVGRGNALFGYVDWITEELFCLSLRAVGVPGACSSDPMCYPRCNARQILRLGQWGSTHDGCSNQGTLRIT